MTIMTPLWFWLEEYEDTGPPLRWQWATRACESNGVWYNWGREFNDDEKP